MFAFEADPNARMVQHLKEYFKTQGRLPHFAENANAILDINIYNIAKSRRKQIFGLESLEENEGYAREIDDVERVRIQFKSLLVTAVSILTTESNIRWDYDILFHRQQQRTSRKHPSARDL